VHVAVHASLAGTRVNCALEALLVSRPRCSAGCVAFRAVTSIVDEAGKASHCWAQLILRRSCGLDVAFLILASPDGIADGMGKEADSVAYPVMRPARSTTVAVLARKSVLQLT
jgi:hypothetical protein